jgi:hypothetical protein
VNLWWFFVGEDLGSSCSSYRGIRGHENLRGLTYRSIIPYVHNRVVILQCVAGLNELEFVCRLP